MTAALGKERGQPGFDPRTDLNQDGVVNSDDVALLQQGVVPRGNGHGEDLVIPREGADAVDQVALGLAKILLSNPLI